MAANGFLLRCVAQPQRAVTSNCFSGCMRPLHSRVSLCDVTVAERERMSYESFYMSLCCLTGRSLSTSMGDANGRKICSNAAQFGHLWKFALQRGCEWSWEEIENYAAGEGHLHILKRVRDNGVRWNTKLCSWAAQGGDLKLISGREQMAANGTMAAEQRTYQMDTGKQ
jgi:hypothetical protein